MRNFFLQIGNSVSSFDWKTLGSSFSEVLWLTGIALFPLMINIIISWANLDSFRESVELKVIPGEILSYSLSFIAPALYLINKTNGSGYKLPLIHFVSFMSIFIYVCAIVLYLVAKNNWVQNVNMEHHKFDIFFKLSLILLIVTIIFRVYSIFHGKRSSDYLRKKKDEEDAFVNKFREALKKNL